MKIDKKLSESTYPQKGKRFYFPQESMLYLTSSPPLEGARLVVHMSDSGIYQCSSQRIEPPVFSGTDIVSVSGYDWEALSSSP